MSMTRYVGDGVYMEKTAEGVKLTLFPGRNDASLYGDDIYLDFSVLNSFALILNDMWGEVLTASITFQE